MHDKFLRTPPKMFTHVLSFLIFRKRTIFFFYFLFTDYLSNDKFATQSHTFYSLVYNYGANSALDGNTATCARTEVIGTNSQHKTVWWKMDLVYVYNIYSINIQFKTYPDLGL